MHLMSFFILQSGRTHISSGTSILFILILLAVSGYPVPVYSQYGSFSLGIPEPRKNALLAVPFGGYCRGIDENTTDVWITGLELGFHHTDTHCFAFRAYWADFKDPAAPTSGFGGSSVIRYCFFQKAWFTLFMDFSMGFIVTESPFPPGGSEFNFTRDGSLGTGFRPWTHMEILACLRHWHISNGYLFGRNRNPSFNGLGGTVLFVFRM